MKPKVTVKPYPTSGVVKPIRGDVLAHELDYQPLQIEPTHELGIPRQLWKNRRKSIKQRIEKLYGAVSGFMGAINNE